MIHDYVYLVNKNLKTVTCIWNPVPAILVQFQVQEFRGMNTLRPESLPFFFLVKCVKSLYIGLTEHTTSNFNVSDSQFNSETYDLISTSPSSLWVYFKAVVPLEDEFRPQFQLLCQFHPSFHQLWAASLSLLKKTFPQHHYATTMFQHVDGVNMETSGVSMSYLNSPPSSIGLFNYKTFFWLRFLELSRSDINIKIDMLIAKKRVSDYLRLHLESLI